MIWKVSKIYLPLLSPSTRWRCGNIKARISRCLLVPLTEHSGAFLKKIDKDGTVIDEFISISEAARQVGVRRESLRDCVLGRQHTCVGYVWRYKY